jgi:hypothetical protein
MGVGERKLPSKSLSCGATAYTQVSIPIDPRVALPIPLFKRKTGFKAPLFGFKVPLFKGNLGVPPRQYRAEIKICISGSLWGEGFRV